MTGMDKRPRQVLPHKGGPGRPSKGDRDLLVTRPARAVGDAVRESAEREGYYSISEYVAAVLAAHEGMPELAPHPVHNANQEVLDISA